MQCENVHSRSADYLDGMLSPADASEVAEHLRVCDECAEEMDQLRSTWEMLGAIPAVPADSAVLRARVEAAIAGYRQGAEVRQPSRLRDRLEAWLPSWPAPGLIAQAAAAAVVLMLGVLLGRQGAAPPAPDPQLSALREELRDMRQLVTLSLMQQQSASERLKGVSWTSQIEQPGGEVVTALLDALIHDPNVNVRLASIDALGRFAERDLVRRAMVDALERQTSPLVQTALINFVVETRDRDSVATLRRLAEDPMVENSVRSRAAWGVQRLAAAL
jgi:HEAT repeats/Putative zinc-finger